MGGKLYESSFMVFSVENETKIFGTNFKKLSDNCKISKKEKIPNFEIFKQNKHPHTKFHH